MIEEPDMLAGPAHDGGRQVRRPRAAPNQVIFILSDV